MDGSESESKQMCHDSESWTLGKLKVYHDSEFITRKCEHGVYEYDIWLICTYTYVIIHTCAYNALIRIHTHKYIYVHVHVYIHMYMHIALFKDSASCQIIYRSKQKTRGKNLKKAREDSGRF